MCRQKTVYVLIKPTLPVKYRQRWRYWLAFALLCGSYLPAAAMESPGQYQTKTVATEQQTVRLTSLDWAPYTGAALPEGGETTHLLRQVFAEMGYQLQVDFRLSLINLRS